MKRYSTHLFSALILGIVVIGAFLRFVYFDLMEFKADEVEALTITRYWLGRGLPQFGQMSSAGIPFPPGFIYLLYPVVALTSSPLWICFYITCFNLAAVGLLWRLGVAVGSPPAGLWAAGFMAVHPWLILYARKIWTPNPLPFFVVLLFLVLARCSRSSRSRTVFWIGPLASVIGQIHYSGYCVAVFLVVWFLFQAAGRRLNWTAALAGLLAGFILFLPYLNYITRTNFADLDYAARLIFRGGPEVARKGLWLVDLWGKTAFAGGFGYPFLSEAVPLASTPLGAEKPWLDLLAKASTALMLLFAGAGVLLGRDRKKPDANLSGFAGWLFLFAVIPVLLYAAKGARIPPHHYIVSIPAGLMLAGMGVEKLKAVLGKTGLFRGCLSFLPSLAGLLVVAYGVIIWFAFISYINRVGGTGGDYGLAYRAQEAAAEKLFEEKINPHRIDARLTRDNSIGVFYLLEYGFPKPGSYSDRRARLVDSLLFEGQGCAAGEESVGAAKTGPLKICFTAGEAVKR